jgi:hypothetical protein
MRIMNKYSKIISVILTSILLMPLFGFNATTQVLQFKDFPSPTLINILDKVDNYANSSPDLFTYQYSKPADSPMAPGDIFQPRFGGEPVKGSAVVSGVTAQADPDRSIVLQGKDFSAGNTPGRVWVFGQTSANNGSYYTAGTLLADDKTITAALTADKPYGMYLAWVENAKGLSYPVRINAPRVLWISDTEAKSGKEVSLYGNNLSYQNGEKISYVYLRLWGASASTKSVKADVVQVNPYKVTFKVPNGLKANADYEVWLHNGHGGDYGWAGPQKLRVTTSDPFIWNGRIVDVTKFGANAADKNNDDTGAIIQAIQSAGNGDIIYFPSGTYKVSTRISILNKSLHFKGDDKSKSIIYSDPAFQNINESLFYVSGAPVKFSGLGFIDDKPNGVDAPNFIYINGSNQDVKAKGYIITDCNFEKQPRGPRYEHVSDAMTVSGAENITVSNCTFKVPIGLVFAQCNRIFVHDNLCYGNWIIDNNDGLMMIHCETGTMFDIHSNQIYSLDKLTDPNGTLSFGDYGFVRAIVAQLHYGTGKDYYIADNICDRVGNPNCNCGEIIMFEAPFKSYEGFPVSVNGTGITLADSIPNNVKTGSVVTIVKGNGEGQSREIANKSGSTITIKSAWDILPDTTSRIMITDPFLNTAVYRNQVNGFKTFNEHINAGAGIQAYGNMLNFWAAKNTFSQVMTGIRLTSQYTYPPDSLVTPLYSVFTGIIVEDNKINDVHNGIMMLLSYFNLGSSGEIPTHMAFNCIIRDNQITNAKLSPDPILAGIGGDGISVGSEYQTFATGSINPFWTGNWITNTLLEKNTITNAENAYIRMQRHQANTILRGNSFAGNNTATHTLLIDPSAQQAVIALLKQNTPTVIQLPATITTGSSMNSADGNKTAVTGGTSNAVNKTEPSFFNLIIWIAVCVMVLIAAVMAVLFIINKRRTQKCTNDKGE